MPLRDELEFLEFTDSCRTPLHLAVENGEIDLLTPLLKAGADFEAQDVGKMYTPARSGEEWRGQHSDCFAGSRSQLESEYITKKPYGVKFTE